MNYTFWIPTIISIASLIWNYIQNRQIVHIQTKAEAKKLIHKFQFEKEFAIYNDLLTMLIDLRNAAAALRPVFDFVDRTKTEEEIKNERVDNLNISFQFVAKTFEYNRPFYSREIYIEIENILKISRYEAIDYTHIEKRTKDYWEQGEKNVKLIADSVEKILQLIRIRIEFVEVR